MGFIRVDIRPVIVEMVDAVDRWSTDKDIAACVSEIRALADRIPTLTKRDRFAGQVAKLLLCNMPDRAKRFIGAMGPYDWTRGAYWSAWVLIQLLKVSAFVGLVVTVMRVFG